MGVLSVVGLDEAEHSVYDAVTEVGSATEADLAVATGLAPRKVATVLRALQARGLVEPLLGDGGGWAMTPPEPALDALVHAHQQALARVRAHAQSLAEHAHELSLRRRPAELVTIAEGVESVNAHFEQLQRGARHEVLAFDRPPYPRSGGTGGNPLQDQLLQEGIAFRCVYDGGMLSDPGIFTRVKADLSAGVQGRAMTGLPLKLAVADRTMAMLPLLTPEGTTDQSALVIRASVLLDSLAELFEALWERAVPLRLDAPAVAGVDPALIEVVRLLASGLTDAGIARHLGTSERTVRRKVAEAMQVLGASSRLQAGMLAERKGWLAG
jgi:DNA-binding CsgD family transcriptional regulator